MLFAEDGPKKQLIFEKHDYFKIVKMGHYAKAIWPLQNANFG